MVRKPNFSACSAYYVSHPTLVPKYGWTGSVVGIEKNASTQISVEGCNELCGDGTEFYAWTDIAATITTWVLPAIGVVVQAPFESNRNRATLRCLIRWIGSPIASLTTVLWNMSVTGRCALLVDMAASTDGHAALDDEDFKDFRDSFYLLSAMNQFSMNLRLRHEEARRWTDGLLRVVLFSRDLQLRTPDGTNVRRLRELRQETAEYLREHRKRGVVPIFISTSWFIVAMAISIQAAFGHIGQNAAAHDLAIGLLVAWLPLLMLATIVDRNFVSTRGVRRKLNDLVYETARALSYSAIEAPVQPRINSRDYFWLLKHEVGLLNPEDKVPPEWEANMTELVLKCRNYVRRNDVLEMASESDGPGGFFKQFAGQGRVRRHHGAANTLLMSIERSYVSSRGRGWLMVDEQLARLNLILGRSKHGLMWFDKRELWQVVGSTTIVAVSIIGAGVLSFCVPTIGLGCRSGSYMIFLVSAFALQVAELTIWAAVVVWRGAQEPHTVNARHSKATLYLFRVTRAVQSQLYKRWLNKSAKLKASSFFSAVDNLIFLIWESCTAFGLILIILLQTIGGFETCSCQASTWTKWGGYIDFTLYDISDVEYMRLGWIFGTSISCFILGSTMIWIFIQWCIQSHISTEEYYLAKSGLQRTRWFIRFIYIYIWPMYRFPLGGVGWSWKAGKCLQQSSEYTPLIANRRQSTLAALGHSPNTSPRLQNSSLSRTNFHPDSPNQTPLPDSSKLHVRKESNYGNLLSPDQLHPTAEPQHSRRKRSNSSTATRPSFSGSEHSIPRKPLPSATAARAYSVSSDEMGTVDDQPRSSTDALLRTASQDYRNIPVFESRDSSPEPGSLDEETGRGEESSNTLRGGLGRALRTSSTRRSHSSAESFALREMGRLDRNRER